MATMNVSLPDGLKHVVEAQVGEQYLDGLRDRVHRARADRA